MRLAAALLLLAAPLLAQPRAEAPFAALRAGRVGAPYRDSLRELFLAPPAGGYRLVEGRLPAGLALDAATGELAGTPSEPFAAGRLVFAARSSSGPELRLRAALLVLSTGETEVRSPGPSAFRGPGPHRVISESDAFDWTSSLDGRVRPARARIHRPDLPGPVPLLVFHRGRGFRHSDYELFLGGIAAWGFACASIDDPHSFAGEPGGPLEQEYDSIRPELGMLSGSAAQEALLDRLLERARTPGDPLQGRLDPEAVFVSGHSRGGGATHGSHVRAIPLRARGAIYFMAFDLRYFAECRPPAGRAPAYPIPDAQPRLPSLVLAAQEDGDLVYPWSDRFIDRATGPTTFVTVLGAVHNYLGDTTPAEGFGFGGQTKITREEERARIQGFVVAFLRRWARDEVALEGFLYGDEHAGSREVQVASWRGDAPLLLVEDFQDADPATNRLGGANLVAGPASRVEEDSYPARFGDWQSLGIRHSALDVSGSAAASLQLGLGGPRDLSGFGALAFRISEPAGTGYRCGLWARLVDRAGAAADVQLAAPDRSVRGWLPVDPISDLRPNRFLTVRVPLARFAAANPRLDLGAVREVTLVATGPVRLVFDDVRFEGGVLSSQAPAPPAPAPVIVSAADGSARAAPGAILAAYGRDLAPSTEAAGSVPLPRALGGLTVEAVDAAGARHAVELFYASPDQVNLLLPTAVGLGEAELLFLRAGATQRARVRVQATAPGLFAADATGRGPAAATALRVRADGTREPLPVFRALPAGGFALEPLDLGPGEEVYLSLYATGLGRAARVEVELGGLAGDVTFAGPQGGYPGLDQVNVRLPAALRGRGEVDVVLVADGVRGNTVRVAIR